MLTEQDFYEMIVNTSKSINIGGTVFSHPEYQNAAQLIHSQHLSECERLMELAFKAATEPHSSVDMTTIHTYPPKYPSFQF